MNETRFFAKVYAIVSGIPEGKVATYGQIALMAGNPYASRMVGYAMSRAPSNKLPCHRVVNRDGRMAPGHVFGGQDIQRSMLEREGITFRPNGCINMEKHLWRHTPGGPVKKE
jgi:methylated-DNA-protein-cysteine methyltransferase-like protein